MRLDVTLPMLSLVILLNLLIVRAGNSASETHVRGSGKSRSYITTTSQNKIKKCIGQVIPNIINYIKENRHHTIIADKAFDSSRKENLSVGLHATLHKLI